MKTIARQIVAGMLATLFTVTTAQAAAITVFLDQTNVDPALPDGVPYLEVTVSDGLDGDIDFSVRTLDALLSRNPNPNAYGIRQFAFNFGSSFATIDDLLLPTGWAATPGVERDFAKFGFGLFDVILHTNRDYRADPLQFSIAGVEGDTVDSYVTQLSSGNAVQGNMLFAAFVAGFDAGSVDKWKHLSAAKFGGATVVPLPPAVAMMLSGIAVLGGMSLRKKYSVAEAR